ncbi:MAG: sigma-70 family RNA polymerase sigma factor [Gemmatimonadaceae bacterium]|nr:sigma-70 family RNA polymerase sigma factor [Gemmatimonadaceae bacterium]
MHSREQEQLLVQAAASGDAKAFAALVQAEESRARAVAWRLTRDPAAAAEIAHEAFARLHRALATWRGDARVATWLYRTVLNLCHDRKRAAGRERALVSLEELDEMPAPDAGPDEAAEAADRAQRVGLAVQALPASMRETVILRYVRGLDYEQIAATLECSAGTVASRLHRALRLLGAVLAEQGINEGSL